MKCSHADGLPGTCCGPRALLGHLPVDGAAGKLCVTPLRALHNFCMCQESCYSDASRFSGWFGGEGIGGVFFVFCFSLGYFISKG